MALLSFTAYFIFLETGAFFLVFYCMDFTKIRRFEKLISHVLGILISCDVISFAINIVTQHYFYVCTTRFAGENFYQFIYSKPYLVHLSLVYLMLLISLAYVVAAMLKVSEFYKRKFLNSIIIIIAVGILNFASKILKVPVDFSIFFYLLLAIPFYFFPFVYIPLRLRNRGFRKVIDSMDTGFILFDNENSCVFVNAMVQKNFKTTRKNILNSEPLCHWIDKNDFERLSEYSEYFDYVVDGEKKNFKIFFHKIEDSKKKYIGSYYTILNITEETERIKIEHEKATRDKLTGLYNRDYFCEKVQKRLSMDRATGYLIIVSDIMNFKLINDLFGTEFGDIILNRIASELRNLSAKEDIYGRLHNDHFVMLIPKYRFNEKFFIDQYNRIFEFLNRFAYSLVCHFGIYEISDYTLPVSVMCDRAFLALKKIRADYTSRFGYYDDKLRQEVVKIQELMNELPLALKAGQLEMYLQPQVSSEKKLIGAEALVRWNHHKKGFVAPCEFIQVIEKINMIYDVDHYVWEAACKKLAEWKKQGREDLYISVNISPKDFYIVDVYEVFMALVKKYEISPKNLNLEITETAIMVDFENQLKLIKKLRDAGFAVEIDDFGSGYSSLNMLKDVEVDVLKIDMAFLKKSENEGKSRIILNRIINLAKELGLKVVTEGVETEEQVEFLTGMGCDIFQGYYFSKPVTTQQFEQKYF